MTFVWHTYDLLVLILPFVRYPLLEANAANP